MLVISRRPGDRIYLGENVCIEVVSIIGGQVRLLFNAPKSVRITRGELLGKPIREKFETAWGMVEAKQ